VPGQLVADVGALFDEHLDKRAGFLRIFPWRGALARGQLDDHIADTA